MTSLSKKNFCLTFIKRIYSNNFTRKNNFDIFKKINKKTYKFMKK